MTESLSRADVYSTILSAGKSPFGIKYKKLDGTVRDAIGCMHVSEPPSDVTKPGKGACRGIDYIHAHSDYGMIKYFDCEKRCWRNAKIGNILELRVNSVHYQVI